MGDRSTRERRLELLKAGVTAIAVLLGLAASRLLRTGRQTLGTQALIAGAGLGGVMMLVLVYDSLKKSEIATSVGFGAMGLGMFAGVIHLVSFGPVVIRTLPLITCLVGVIGGMVVLALTGSGGSWFPVFGDV